MSRITTPKPSKSLAFLLAVMKAVKIGPVSHH
jgi:hypothetical protein